MFKKILTLILAITMLALTSCSVVGVIDHSTTSPEENNTPQTEYEPWGFWYSNETLMTIQFTKDTNKTTIYSIAPGYYEYDNIMEVDCTFDGNATFTVVSGSETLTFTFDKFKNTLVCSDKNYVRKDNAPEKHPEFSLPNFKELNASSYITVGDIDFDPIAKLVFEGAPYNIAMTYYGSMKQFPKAAGDTLIAQSGYVVNIDYMGMLDGVAFDGGTAAGVTLFISDYQNGYIPGFTDGIIGHAIGETFDVPVTFPENYGATDLAGKAVIFQMTLNYICDMTLTDEMVAEYKDNAYQTYQEWLEDEQLAVTTELLADAVLSATTTNVSLPSDLYLYYYQQALDYYHLLAYYYGIDFSWLMSYYGLTETAIMQQAMNQATYNAALFVLMEQHELSWTDEEYTQKYNALITDYLEVNKDASTKDAVAYADGMKNHIELDLAEEKVLIWSFGMIFPSQNQ